MVTILEVQLDGRRYGLRITDVDEVVRAVAVTPVPGVPPVAEGVIDYRGTVIPVLNLRRRFGLPEAAPALGDRMVIGQAAGRRVAMRVDAAERVVELDESEIETAHGLWAAGTRVAGAVQLGEGLVLIAEMGSFLSQAEAEALEGAVATAERAGA